MIKNKILIVSPPLERIGGVNNYVRTIIQNNKSNENEIKHLKETSIKNINKIAINISSEVIKQVVGTEVNESNVTAIVEDIYKRNMEIYK